MPVMIELEPTESTGRLQIEREDDGSFIVSAEIEGQVVHGIGETFPLALYDFGVVCMEYAKILVNRK